MKRAKRGFGAKTISMLIAVTVLLVTVFSVISVAGAEGGGEWEKIDTGKLVNGWYPSQSGGWTGSEYSAMNTETAGNFGVKFTGAGNLDYEAMVAQKKIPNGVGGVFATPQSLDGLDLRLTVNGDIPMTNVIMLSFSTTPTGLYHTQNDGSDGDGFYILFQQNGDIYSNYFNTNIFVKNQAVHWGVYHGIRYALNEENIIRFVKTGTGYELRISNASWMKVDGVEDHIKEQIIALPDMSAYLGGQSNVYISARYFCMDANSFGTEVSYSIRVADADVVEEWEKIDTGKLVNGWYPSQSGGWTGSEYSAMNTETAGNFGVKFTGAGNLDYEAMVAQKKIPNGVGGVFATPQSLDGLDLRLTVNGDIPMTNVIMLSFSTTPTGLYHTQNDGSDGDGFYILFQQNGDIYSNYFNTNIFVKNQAVHWGVYYGIRYALNEENIIRFVKTGTGYELRISNASWMKVDGVEDHIKEQIIALPDMSAYLGGQSNVYISARYFCMDANSFGTEVSYSIRVADADVEEEVDTGISLVKAESGEDFIVKINNWISTHKYQIWTYQKTESEIFGGEGQTNQWVLSHPYTLGSDRGENGFTVDGDAITRNIGPFNSVDSNYTVAVKVIDGAGNFVGQYKDTFTQAEAGEVVINKVTVDGVFADDKAFVKDIANDSPVAFVVTGNGVAGTVYTAKVDQTGDQLVASGAGLNEFSWDISLMQPGNYSVTLTASTADSSDSRTVNINLYKNDPAVVYGEMTELVVTGAAENDNFKIDINPTVTGGKFRYRISEPWRGTIPGGDSELVEIPAAPLSNTAIPRTAYGVYEVQTFTYRDGVSSADDGAVRTVTNVRPGEPVTLNVTVDGNPAGAEMITKAKGTAIVFTPAATGLPLPQYSFWRRDANGWVLIRDYSGEGLTWTPNRVGLYTIQVRAKATGGLTYEVLKNIEFDITDATDKKAVVTGIAINQAVLDTDAKTRTPILITANATSAEQDLLYKFIISNGYIYYVETAYSADPTYMWVPGKSGNYIINVLVKNQASFGKYDAVETFTVNVKN